MMDRKYLTGKSSRRR